MPESAIIWLRTYEDDLTREDYVGYAGSRKVGRVYENPAVAGQWQWFSNWDDRRAGNASSRRAAMMELEEALRKSREARE